MESTDYRLVYEQAAEIIRTEPHYVSWRGSTGRDFI